MSTYGRQMGAGDAGGIVAGAGSTTSSTGDGVAVVISRSGGTWCSGRFLTMHKRRRKRLMTRSLQSDGAMLDDVHHGQVQRMLDRCGLWGFNAFTLETVAGGRSLPVLCVHLFHWYGLLDHFRLDVVRVWKLFTLIEEGYHSTNPYHNSIHATDVTQAMHCFLQEDKIRRHVTPVEIMAALIGAVAHDLDHPGVNQHFLISTSNHLAILYENRSVLENHHWRSALGCLLESGVADQVVSHRPDLEVQIRELILATDINRQQEFLTKFRQHLDEDTLDLTIAENRQFILQIALKCADISNPTRPWDISHKWSLKVCDEFFRQGNFERKLNLPVTSICDQQSTTVAKIQSGFFKFVVTPLFSEWHRFCASALSTHMMRQLETNRQRWETQEQAEEAARASAALSDSGELSDEPVSDVVISEDEDATRKDSSGTTGSALGMEFMSPPTLPRDSGRRQSLAVPTLSHALGTRRHSVPVNLDPLLPTTTPAPPAHASHVVSPVVAGLSGPLPRTIYRRESLPAGRGMPAVARTSPVPSEGSRLREEEEMSFGRFGGSRGGSIGSMVSSSPGGSGVLYSAMEDDLTTDDPDRPLSAENLLPEPSIASMTAASYMVSVGRISSILQGTAAVLIPSARDRALTRQQTFPPPQPYVRVRYMSATAEMSTCKETVHEDDSRSTSPTHSHTPSPIPPPSSTRHSHPHTLSLTTPAPTTYHIPSIAVLSPTTMKTTAATTIASPPQIVLSEGTPPATNQTATMMFAVGESVSGKREQPEQSGGGKVKLVKLVGEKENVDPRRFATVGSASASLSKRRSSAPLNLPIMQLSEEKGGHVITSSAGRGLYSTSSTAFRRGSVPIEFSKYKIDDEMSSTTTSSSVTTATTTIQPSVEHPYALWRHQQRRGSAPSDLPPPGPHTTCLERKEILLLTRHTSLNGKHRRGTGGGNGATGGNGGKKQPLRRRSSGGPETVCLADVISSSSEGMSAAGNLARLLQKRRGTVDVGALAAAAAAATGIHGGSEDMMLLARRRGSLPIEVLSVGNSVF